MHCNIMICQLCMYVHKTMQLTQWDSGVFPVSIQIKGAYLLKWSTVLRPFIIQHGLPQPPAPQSTQTTLPQEL